jgi:hypothetical protein
MCARARAFSSLLLHSLLFFTRCVSFHLANSLFFVFFLQVVRAALDKGIALVIPSYVEEEEFYLPTPSIRLAVSCEHDAKEIQPAMVALASIIREVCPSPAQGLSF